jgi:hypothetical protein
MVAGARALRSAARLGELVGAATIGAADASWRQRAAAEASAERGERPVR